MLDQRINYASNSIINHCDVDPFRYFDTGYDQERVEAEKKGGEKID